MRGQYCIIKSAQWYAKYHSYRPLMRSSTTVSNMDLISTVKNDATYMETVYSPGGIYPIKDDIICTDNKKPLPHSHSPISLLKSFSSSILTKANKNDAFGLPDEVENVIIDCIQDSYQHNIPKWKSSELILYTLKVMDQVTPSYPISRERFCIEGILHVVCDENRTDREESLQILTKSIPTTSRTLVDRMIPLMKKLLHQSERTKAIQIFSFLYKESKNQFLVLWKLQKILLKQLIFLSDSASQHEIDFIFSLNHSLISQQVPFSNYEWDLILTFGIKHQHYPSSYHQNIHRQIKQKKLIPNAKIFHHLILSSFIDENIAQAQAELNEMSACNIQYTKSFWCNILKDLISLEHFDAPQSIHFIFEEMKKNEEMNENSVYLLIQYCKESKDSSLLHSILSILKEEYPQIQLQTKALNNALFCYTRNEDLKSAEKLILNSKQFDEISLQALIVGCHQDIHKALSYVNSFVEKGIHPSLHAFTSLLSICSSSNQMELGHQLHTMMRKEMKSCLDLPAYTASGYFIVAKDGLKGLIQLLREMENKNIIPDKTFFHHMIKTLIKYSTSNSCMDFLYHLQQHQSSVHLEHCDLNTIYNIVCMELLNANEVEMAMDLYSEMKCQQNMRSSLEMKDFIPYSCNKKQALKIFWLFRQHSEKIDLTTCNQMISLFEQFNLTYPLQQVKKIQRNLI